MRLQQVRHFIELHQLRTGSGLPLLLLHPLYASTQDWQLTADAWDGPVYGLDFPGHGASEWVLGGAYYPEYFAASADIALNEIGTAALAGAGLGAYVALLLAGGRPDLVPAALLLPGAGLAGAGAAPDHSRPLPNNLGAASQQSQSPRRDPLVACLDMFLHPPEYARRFALAAKSLVLAEDGSTLPPWWDEVRKCPAAAAVHGGVSEGLLRLRRLLVHARG